MPDQHSTPLTVAQGTPPVGGVSACAVGAAPPPDAGLVSLATSSREILETRKNKLRRMRRGVLSSSRILQDQLQEGGHRYRAAMVTVTYADSAGWRPRDIAELTHRYRDWLNRRGHPARYVWVLEAQSRGTPHYHLVLWLPRGLTPPKPDRQGWWRHGHSNCKWARSPVGYMAKYASKGDSKGDLPANARLWGVAGLGGHGRNVLRWWLAPAWLRGMATAGDVLRHINGWWENRTIGIAYRSPWVLDTFSGGCAEFIYLGWSEEDVRFFDPEPCGV